MLRCGCLGRTDTEKFLVVVIRRLSRHDEPGFDFGVREKESQNMCIR